MNDNRTGIQADEPLPPWERPGYFRRDCEPHRGESLIWMARLSLIPGTITILCMVASSLLPSPVVRYDLYLAYIILLLNAGGVFFGLTVLRLARRDLARMRRGSMEPHGSVLIRKAIFDAMGGLILNGSFAATFGMLLLIHGF